MAARSDPRSTIFTVGHSNRSLVALTDLLREAGVRAVADVRRFATSRRHPHFRADSLERVLGEAGFGYRHLPALGGFRGEPEDPSPVAALPARWRAYAAYMQQDGFAAACDALLAFADRHGPAAVLCAERDPEDCHRHLLADALLARGQVVVHLLGPGSAREHVRHPACRAVGTRVSYPGAQRRLFG